MPYGWCGNRWQAVAEIGDGRARAKSFRIGFDPSNARVIRLVAREMSSRRVRSFIMLSDATKMKMREQYAALAKELPKDPVAPKYIQIIDKTLGAATGRLIRKGNKTYVIPDAVRN